MTTVRAVRYADPQRRTGTVHADPAPVDLAAITARGRRLHDRAVARAVAAAFSAIGRAVGRAVIRRVPRRPGARATGVAIGRC